MSGVAMSGVAMSTVRQPLCPHWIVWIFLVLLCAPAGADTPSPGNEHAEAIEPSHLVSEPRILDAYVPVETSEGGSALNLDILLARLQAQGMGLAIVSNDGADEWATNEMIRQAVRTHPNRLRGLLQTRPVDGSAEQMAPLIKERLPNGERLLVGLEFDPERDGFAADDPRIDPYMELCARHYRPAVFHSGAPGSAADPTRILATARKYPKVPVVLYPPDSALEGEAAIQTVARALEAGDADLYLGTGRATPEMVLRAVRELGAERVLFGTATADSGKAYGERNRAVVGLLEEELGAVELARVLGGNAVRLFDVQSMFDGPAVDSGRVASTERYAFHSPFWLGLHHFLYQWAYAEGEWKDWRQPKEMAERTDPSLSESEQAAWQQAVDVYQAEVVSKDLLRDYELGILKRRLITLKEISPLDFVDLQLPIYEALATAAPIYRKHWWPGHDRQNRRWVGQLLVRLLPLEEAATLRLAAAFDGAWPDHQVRVDVVPYSNWAGAYTSTWPATHIVISSTNPTYQGDHGFEMILHETSHTDRLIVPVHRGLFKAFSARDMRPPQDLWHVILFWTSGEVARQLLAQEGVEDHVMYAEKGGLFEGRWGPLWQAIEGSWTAAFSGEMSREEAYEAVAAKWLAAQEKVK